MFKIFVWTTDGKTFVETSFAILAIEEFIRLHASHIKKVEVFDEEANLILFLDTKYFEIEKFIPEDESEIPF